jgi:hypothetical protein
VIICEIIIFLLVIVENNVSNSSSLGGFVRFLFFVLRSTCRFAALLLPGRLSSRGSGSTALVLLGFLVINNHTTHGSTKRKAVLCCHQDNGMPVNVDVSVNVKITSLLYVGYYELSL